MPTFGTDLLVATTLGQAALTDVLASTLPVRRSDVFVDEVIDTVSDAQEAFFAALGRRNVIRVHALAQPANLAFKVDCEFVHPIPIGRMQPLAEAVGGVVALSRQTAFPDEIGRPIGEGYVIFRPGLPPHSGAVQERGLEDDLWWDWVLTNDPLPTLPR